jgi:hypothetical protein
MKLPFVVETQINKILKPNLITVVETFIDNKKQKKFYGKSLTGNFLQWLYGSINNGDADFLGSNLGIALNNNQVRRADTGAATVLSTAGIQLDANANTNAKGIVLSDDVTAITPASFNIGTLIANGNGANQLIHSAGFSIQGCQITGANTSFVLERNFDNQSAGNVSVQKIGLWNGATTGGFLWYADAVSPADIIPSGSVYTVRITFTITT